MQLSTEGAFVHRVYKFHREGGHLQDPDGAVIDKNPIRYQAEMQFPLLKCILTVQHRYFFFFFNYSRTRGHRKRHLCESLASPCAGWGLDYRCRLLCGMIREPATAHSPLIITSNLHKGPRVRKVGVLELEVFTSMERRESPPYHCLPHPLYREDAQPEFKCKKAIIEGYRIPFLHHSMTWQDQR